MPTREEMKEIETSNRLYEDNGALYMTTTVAAQLDTDRPVGTAVTFILTGSRLVTNRYLDTKPFQQFIAYAEASGRVHQPAGAARGPDGGVHRAHRRRAGARRRRPRQSSGSIFAQRGNRHARQPTCAA